MARPNLQFRIVQVVWLVLLATMFQYGHSLKREEASRVIAPDATISKTNASR